MPSPVEEAMIGLKNHLNLLRTGNVFNNGYGTPFTILEAARLAFVQWRYRRGDLTEWPDAH